MSDNQRGPTVLSLLTILIVCSVGWVTYNHWAELNQAIKSDLIAIGKKAGEILSRSFRPRGDKLSQSKPMCSSLADGGERISQIRGLVGQVELIAYPSGRKCVEGPK